MRLHDYLDFHAREHPDIAFAVLGDRQMTYHEALAECNRLASAFASAGLSAGDRVALLSKNSIEYALFFYAASKAGGGPGALNYPVAAPGGGYLINDAE